MKILDKIMRLFGYENIENIHIYRDYQEHPPKEEKMKFRRYYYDATKKFYVPIVIKQKFVLLNWKGILIDDYLPCLIDGYTSYLIAKENNIKYVKVVRV